MESSYRTYIDSIIVENTANGWFCSILFELAEEAIAKRTSLFCNTVEIFRIKLVAENILAEDHELVNFS